MTAPRRHFLHALIPVLALVTGMAGCGREDTPVPDARTEVTPDAQADVTPRGQVDALAARIADNVGEPDIVVTIDHARLAEAEGVMMPPSLVTIYSDKAVNSALIAVDPLIGLDLPHRILAYAEPDADTASVTYADAEFVAKRHGLSDTVSLEGYTKSLEKALEGIPQAQRLPADVDRVEEGYGIIDIPTQHPFDATIERLKEAVLAQSDTKWFAEVDYQADAAELGLEVPRATLLLFGGPGPGGQAMAEFPRLGMDAFCQKLLVYEDEDGAVHVVLNDIAAYAELHYGRTIPIHEGLNGRLTQTFSAALN